MPKIDGIKERIGYLKLWLGIIIAVDVSLFGSLVSYGTETAIKNINILVVAVHYLTIAVLTTFIVYLHHQIERRIKKLESFALCKN